ncbi:hypothetical protein C8P66_12355 [Humitalea rosea]|uniref:Uncharacterized protein n=1 Tax=Humitalea rosea TaxID=990373 RepID=A0A2W7I3E9_9PROT|nr:hypothetical protein [Humitalea rosea]PZW40848.1 hypothetical protein C8P66_12355 [Humitalea rosea]
MPLMPKTPSARRFARAGAFVLSLVMTSTAAMADMRCSDPREQSHFEVTALKTELMVIALICEERDNYNAFITRYRPTLIETDRGFTAYFNRALGRAGTRQLDAYVTALANSRQQGAQMLGSDFCPRNRILFEEVAALGSTADLAGYAAGKDLVPAALGACAAAPAPVRQASRNNR